MPYSVSGRLEDDGSNTARRAQSSIKAICGYCPTMHDDGSFSIRVEEQKTAWRIHALLVQHRYNMREKPWKVADI